MFRNSFFYLQLTLLCFRLVGNIFFFCCALLVNQFNLKRVFPSILILLIILSWIFNLQLKNQRDTPIINLRKASQFGGTESTIVAKKVVVGENDLKNQLNFYQNLDNLRIKNLSVLLNLSQIYEIIGQKEASDKHLRAAQQILPTIRLVIK